LNEGPAKIAELTAEAAKLGLVFGNDAANGVDAMNDSLTRAMAAIKGAGRELVTTLGPGIEKVANGFTEMVVVADRRFLMGTEKGPRQEAANKHIANLSDQNFMDFTKANPLGELDEFLAKAVRDRVDKMVEQQNHFGGDAGFGGLLAPGMNLAMQQFQADAATFMATKGEGMTDPAEEARISAFVNELGIAGNAPNIKKLKRADNHVQTNGALEYGTAAAFSQSRKSDQAGKMLDVSQKQLKQNEMQTKALQNIDKNLKASQPIEVVNLA
jgi:hypothetical protein